jgi:tetratricopeptide (TPR) repeat protein
MMAGGLLLAFPSPTKAQPSEAQHHFEAGNGHYVQGDYQAAVGAYRAALGTGYASGALYYNLGNAYFRSDSLGPAILYYEKARRLLPNDAKLLHSLDVARSAANAPPPPVSRGWSSFVASVNPGISFLLGLLVYGGSVGWLVYRYWHGAVSTVRRLDGAPMIAGLALIGLALVASYAQTLDHRAVVIAQKAPLYTRPMEDQAARDTTLSAGAVLRLQRRQPNWSEVELSSGRAGWMRTDALADV